jgi:hypothetical protein
MGRSRRITLDLTPEARRTMDKLMGMLECKSEAEVIRKALSTYHYLLVESGLGGTILVRHDDQQDKEVLIK